MLLEKNLLRWKDPNPKKERDEVKYQHKIATGKATPAKGAVGIPGWVKKRLKDLKHKHRWKEALKAGMEKRFHRKDIKNIGWFGPRGNTGETWKQILHHKYFDQSDRETFKHVNTPAKIKDAVRNKRGVRKPVVLHNPRTGQHWLIGGHHRLAYISTVLRKPVAAHVIEQA